MGNNVFLKEIGVSVNKSWKDGVAPTVFVVTYLIFLGLGLYYINEIFGAIRG